MDNAESVPVNNGPNQGHTIKPGTPEHGTLAEQRNTGKTIGITRNSGTCEEQLNNLTTKQHQEILPKQSDDILSR